MGKRKNLAGKTFGRLFVQYEAISPDEKKRWACRCRCGRRTVVRGAELTRIRKPVRSCGCLHKSAITTHGQTGTRTYRIWRGMINRCENKKMQTYPNYGGRGIGVCARWKRFDTFLADMGPAPAGLSIERKDNNGHYTPDNCRWATQIEQGRNRRTNRLLAVGTLIMPLSAWAEALGGNRGVIRQRLLRGWPVEAACTLPVRALHIEET